MNVIENVVINLIFILFPLMIYFIYCCYTSLNKNKYVNIVLLFSLFSSMYLFLKYGYSVNDSKILLFSNIPIVIAYIKKEYKVGILLSLFLIIYCYYVFNISILFMTIKFILYYICYFFFNKSKLNVSDFISVIAVVQAFFLSFEVFYAETLYLYNIMEIFLLVGIFYVITFFVLFMFSFIDKLVSVFYQIKELEKEKELKNALFKLTHEIKNPLAVCKGYLDMLNINDKKNSEKYINILRQEIDRSLNIMNDFLDYNRIKINKELIDINYLLEDVYNSFKILNNSKNIKLKYRVIDDEIYVNGDYDRLKQVMLNLIKNSMEAIAESGNINISLDVDNNKCIINIIDDGEGMSDDTLNNIKNLFYTTKSFGSGIGVSLSNEIIKAHGGELNYYSKLGNGTRVEVILPKEKEIY